MSKNSKHNNDQKPDQDKANSNITIEDSEAQSLNQEDLQEEENQEAESSEKEISPLEELKAQLKEQHEKYLRLMAEYENYRKRSTKEKTEIYPQATAAAIEKFLPVFDNIERAMEYDKNTEEFAKGFDLICRSFAEVLKCLNVEAFGSVGDPFNPEMHNAVMHIENPDLGENVISLVMQKGYKIGDKVIRYAMVQTAN